MKRRDLFKTAAAGLFAGKSAMAGIDCGCAFAPPQNALGGEAFRSVGSKIKITNVKVFGVSLTPDSDRPYVFVRLKQTPAS